MPPAQWTMTRFSNGCATTGFDCFEGSRQAARLFFNYSVVISAPSHGLTQTVTQTRIKAGGYRRTQWIAHRSESTRKRRKALRRNAFRRSSYLHTQEVTGSSPAVSTKKFLISQEIRNFFAFMSSNSDAAFWRFSLDPNRDPNADRSGKRRRGADGIIRLSLRLFFCGLHGLGDDAADGLQDLLMGVAEGVRIEHSAGLGRYE